MSPEAQRAAIAEACGWSGFENSGEFLIGVRPQNEVTEKLLGPRTVTNWTPRDDVPDFLNDLNAMHEAEKLLDFCQFDRYRADLWLVVGNKDIAFEACAPLRHLRAFVEATAAQRAEAFLHTIGKWEGS